ncbi:TRAP transporter fused permease subunit [Sulfitobacter pseudonitzschiae]|uniref:TRAP transporter fused permease subunit n=1 Tax=Pseudosulfitobacter pseudonitzschiae TaxID=1402135 RepID=A0A9Q2NMJ2_9RHOB|nr:TRAP transporter fused permease subunit [Pseudosulfitobacter pseudonitzschiae]MBM1878662.1 TRAP transporter fused permease subunit [Pseudosulfitobacter pseudonitzschiae]MBM1897832.1 TRAP transporter fused permease subunit [Pseudosulfitobacter pseudonitzschiae]MBM1951100.1 TRAP transporter fused permease subunit [Pseudosulfitobacter pseudonitzschiae]MBM2024045.1 TRAP transporter fused permease subunit [Pseudosulfitobacter pseudonitzschiae]MBM2038474.1 TRAP transporter fused permease subunit 
MSESAKIGPVEGPVARFQRALLICASLWLAFHLVAAAGFIGSHTLRSVHVGGAILLTLAARPLTGRWRIIDACLAAATLIAVAYLVVESESIIMANWFSHPLPEKFLATILFAALMESIRRALGLAFVALICLFIAYAIWGNIIPGALGHRGLSVDRLLFSFYLGTQGVTAMLIGISAGVVALFLVFGEFLNAGGAGRTFINVALRLGGRIHGGAGLVAVIGSAFMGMISGSAVANVASTGVLTIPLMKRLGFSKNLSGSIEAVASTGGQFMPPVMGPGAFLMAELLGISYLDVASAALIPSTLFYIGLLLGVYLLAGSQGLQPVPENLMPSRRVAYAPWAMLSLILPVGLLVGMVVSHYTAQYAVLWALGATVILMMANAAFSDRSKPAKQRAGAFGRTMLEGLDLSARNIAYIGIIIAAAQLIVAVINLTGLGATMSQIIVTLGQENLILSLIVTMMVAIILGMGMPTPAAYAVAAAVLAPPLSRLGLETLPSHLFIYYFACLAAITPPVAAAIFAACAISGGKVIPTSGQALRLALPLFLVPFLFISDPVLLMDAELSRVILATTTGAAGVSALTVATIGFYRAPLYPAVRIGLGCSALLLLVPDWKSDIAGLLLSLALLALHLKWARRSAVAGGEEHAG